ncbi:T9SS type A sorting domain-containing protein [Muribaculum intestinale]|uniref:T9SS type A sorting domain-containing protein n=1 Tax=Muribaculum intestinale TaxID=1796646 RepID=UPI002431E6AD|nr:T9SS type A sorting domain-containing protein [Muribaculum intestinale]
MRQTDIQVLTERSGMCANVEIFNLYGQKVRDFTVTSGQVAIDGLDSGVYIVRVGSASLKFVNRK